MQMNLNDDMYQLNNDYLRGECVRWRREAMRSRRAFLFSSVISTLLLVVLAVILYNDMVVR